MRGYLTMDWDELMSRWVAQHGKFDIETWVGRRLHWRLLDDGTVEPCTLEEWANEFQDMKRCVGFDSVDRWDVSTVFLGLNHNYSFSGLPLIFETMVFEWVEGESHSRGCWRYSTKVEAEEGHQKVLQRLMDGWKPSEEEEDDESRVD